MPWELGVFIFIFRWLPHEGVLNRRRLAFLWGYSLQRASRYCHLFIFHVPPLLLSHILQSSAILSNHSGKYGRWTPAEKAAFLTGLRRFGRGKWKEIAKLIPSRSTGKSERFFHH